MFILIKLNLNMPKQFEFRNPHFNLGIRISKTSSIFANILKEAYLSKGVFCKLIITKSCPLSEVYLAISAAGLTLKLDPRESIKSA